MSQTPLQRAQARQIDRISSTLGAEGSYSPPSSRRMVRRNLFAHRSISAGRAASGTTNTIAATIAGSRDASTSITQGTTILTDTVSSSASPPSRVFACGASERAQVQAVKLQAQVAKAAPGVVNCNLRAA